MKATKKDKLWRLGEMKAARLLHRSFEGKQACELLKGIQKVEERERFALCLLSLFLCSLTHNNLNYRSRVRLQLTSCC